MKPDTWMPLYIADYLRDTMRLTRDEHGAYLLLIMACWIEGGRLPYDQKELAAVTKSTPAEWRKLESVLMRYFRVEDGFLIQGRVVEELEKANKLSEVRRNAGLQGGRPRSSESETNAKAKPKANEKQNETPTRVARPSHTTEGSVSNDTGDERLEKLLFGEEEFEPGNSADAWAALKYVLVERGGSTAKNAGSFVGKLKSQHGLTVDELAALARSAWLEGTEEPQAYLTAAGREIAARRRQGGGPAPRLGQTLPDDNWSPENQRHTLRFWLQHTGGDLGQWDHMNEGPAPCAPGCKFTPSILAEFKIPTERWIGPFLKRAR